MTTSSIASSPDRWPDLGRYDNQVQACFTFFQHHTAGYLATLFDQEWKPLVLSAAEQNNGIFHASLAIASMHRTLLSSQSKSRLDDDGYAVKQYTCALRRLAVNARRSDEVAAVDVMLTACVLFIGFEVIIIGTALMRHMLISHQGMRRNYGVALDHIRSGVRILQEYQNHPLYTKAERTMIPLKMFVPAFVRLERQLQELTGSAPSPLLQGLTARQEAAGYFQYERTGPQPLHHFSSLNNAWLRFHQIWHAMISWASNADHYDWFSHLGDVPRDFFKPSVPIPALEQRNVEFSRDLELWSLGFEDLKRRQANDVTRREASIYALLGCYALFATTVIGATSSRGLLWDDYRDAYEQVLGFCRTVIDYELFESEASIGHVPKLIVINRYHPNTESTKKDASASARDGSCPLTFDMGICSVLLQVIIKCRDARLRLAAIKLLEDYPRLEGLWDGAIIAKLGRIVDRIERQGGSLEDAAARGASAAEIDFSQRVLKIEGGPTAEPKSGELVLFQASGETRKVKIAIG